MGCMKWAFLFPRLLGNETMQAQECCRKGKAYRRLSLLCWHCSIFGSSDILEKRKKKLNLESQCKAIRSTADLCTEKGTRAISPHFPTPLRKTKQKKTKTKRKKPGWTLMYRNVAIKHAPHEQHKTGSLCSRRKASVLHVPLNVHAQCHAQVQNNTHVQPYLEDNRES